MVRVSEGAMKRAVIAGAAHALRYKEKHPFDSEEEVLKQVMKDLRKITEEIDRE